MGNGLHSSTLVVICVVCLLIVLFYVLFVCKCVLPPGDNPIAVNKYITSYYNNNYYYYYYDFVTNIWSDLFSCCKTVCILRLVSCPLPQTPFNPVVPFILIAAHKHYVTLVLTVTQE